MSKEKHIDVEKSSNKWSFSTYLIFRLTMPRYLRSFYKDCCNLELDLFLSNFFKKVDCEYHMSNKILDKIPENQGFITISNHPTGIIEAVLLLYVIRQKRPDYKVAGLPIFKSIKPFSDAIIPLHSLKSKDNNYSGLRQSINYLKKENSIGFFPEAQIVSEFKSGNISLDNSSIKLIKKMNLPIIPIYFDIKPNYLILLLGRLNKKLLMLFLPRIVFLKKCHITMIAGDLISVEKQNKIPLVDFSKYLQSKIYGLKN